MMEAENRSIDFQAAIVSITLRVAGVQQQFIVETTLAADFLISDDLRALPELQIVADARVAISPIILTALVQRDVLEQRAALEMPDQLSEQRDWLRASIYRRARNLIE